MTEIYSAFDSLPRAVEIPGIKGQSGDEYMNTKLFTLEHEQGIWRQMKREGRHSLASPPDDSGRHMALVRDGDYLGIAEMALDTKLTAYLSKYAFLIEDDKQDE